MGLNKVWQTKIINSLIGNISISNNGDFIAVVSGKLLYLLNKDGQLLWKKKGKKVWWRIQIVNNVENVIATSYDKNIYSIDINGEERWKLPLEGPGVGIRSSKDGKTIVATCGKKKIYKLTNDGNLIWKKNLNKKGLSIELSKTDSKIVVGSWDNNVYCLSPDSSLLWEYKCKGVPTRLINVGGNNFLVKSSSNILYNIDYKGFLIWKFEPDFSVKGIDYDKSHNEIICESSLRETNTTYYFYNDSLDYLRKAITKGRNRCFKFSGNGQYLTEKKPYKVILYLYSHDKFN